MCLGVEENEKPLSDKTDDEEKVTTELPVHSIDSTVSSINWQSITWKLLSKNTIHPEEETVNKLLEGYKTNESRPGVLKSKFASPASLPLYFYFGYQLLQESNLLQKLGHVRLKISKLIYHSLVKRQKYDELLSVCSLVRKTALEYTFFYTSCCS